MHEFVTTNKALARPGIFQREAAWMMLAWVGAPAAGLILIAMVQALANGLGVRIYR